MVKVPAKVELLIRKPASGVFDAFVKPRTIERFWLKKASGRLAKDVTVKWDFMVQGASETVKVTEYHKNQVIAFDWSDGVTVKLEFAASGKSNTRLSITARGFKSSAQAVGATEGFAIVACDLKCLLETGQSGNMVRDKAILISAAKVDA